MSACVIEKDVALPRIKCGRRKGSSKYPFNSMEVGDSFVVSNRKAAEFGAYIRSFLRRSGMSAKFSCRTDGKNVRVWRTA